MMDPITFRSNGSIVRGYFFPSKRTPALATILFTQGFPGIEGDELICERLAQANTNVLTFNYRGTFQSQGTFSFSHAIDDIGAAIQTLKYPELQERYSIDGEKLILGGWSFGSGLVPAAAVRNPEISKIFCISGRNFGAEARRIHQDDEYAQEVFNNLVSIRKPNGPATFQDDLLDDLIGNQENLDPQVIAPYLRNYEVLLIGGWMDQVSTIENHLIPFYRSLTEAGNKRVRIEALHADHEFRSCKNDLVNCILEWIQKGLKK